MTFIKTQQPADEKREYSKDGFTASTDRTKLDLDVIHEFLAGSYWARNIPRETVWKSIENSLCFGLFEAERQIGFARAVTDRATFAYVGDVFVLEGYRGRGLGKWLISCLLSHPDLQGLRQMLLFTRDAHGFYEQLGFERITNTDRLMAISRRDFYHSTSSANQSD